jgi:S-adenosylmethionine decarboxylase
MKSKWASRDDLPSSVHSLMSLWGGFDEPANAIDSGLEKRLEIGITATNKDGLLQDRDALYRVLDTISNVTSMSQLGNDSAVLTIHCERCVAVIAAKRLVVLASPDVAIHKAILPLLNLCSTLNCVVEWMSFMRKNTTSPWEAATPELSQIMAGEYADLKEAFPKGKSFLFGPVDTDNYFFFVYDNVNRKTSVVENDVQINAVLYNVKSHIDTKLEQRVDIVEGDEYEVTRTFSLDACTPCLTYETNCSKLSTDRLRKLLNDNQPDRFTLITLFDPHSDMAVRIRAGDRCGLDAFDGFYLDNRTVNEFASGYAIHKLLFVRA